MKRIIARISCLLLPAAVLCAGASAVQAGQDQPVAIPAIAMETRFPLGWDVLTRDMDANAALLAKYELDADTLADEMAYYDQYIEAYSVDSGNSITIHIHEDSWSRNARSMSRLTDADLDDTVADMRNNADYNEYSGIQWERRGGNAYFVYTHGAVSPDYIYYETVVNQQYIEIYLNAWSGAITSADRTALEYVADQAVYDDSEAGNPGDYNSLSSAAISLIVGVLIAVGVVVIGAIILVVVLVRRANKRAPAVPPGAQPYPSAVPYYMPPAAPYPPSYPPQNASYPPPAYPYPKQPVPPQQGYPQQGYPVPGYPPQPPMPAPPAPFPPQFPQQAPPPEPFYPAPGGTAAPPPYSYEAPPVVPPVYPAEDAAPPDSGEPRP